jgi:hypothetical protein
MKHDLFFLSGEEEEEKLNTFFVEEFRKKRIQRHS